MKKNRVGLTGYRRSSQRQMHQINELEGREKASRIFPSFRFKINKTMVSF